MDSNDEKPDDTPTAEPTFESERIGEDLVPVFIKGRIWKAIKQRSKEFPVEVSPEEFLTLCLVWGCDHPDKMFEDTLGDS